MRQKILSAAIAILGERDENKEKQKRAYVKKGIPVSVMGQLQYYLPKP